MSCSLTITPIQPEEYIGNSLATINNNFTELKGFLCNDEGEGLYSRMDGLELSASKIDADVTTLSNLINTGRSRAWVRFSGTKDLEDEVTIRTDSDFTDRKVIAQFNVKNVYRRGQGLYRIYFTTELSNTNYVITGTSSEKINPTTNQYGWVVSQTLGTAFADIKISNNQDPDFVSVIIF